MTTTTAALDNVIEHATETTKAAGERVREFAQIGVRKATEGLEQVSKAARDGSEEQTGQLAKAHESASQAGLKLLEIAKEDTDAGFAALHDLMLAKSPLEAFDVSAKYWRGRLETCITQAQDLGALARKSADDVVRPIQEHLGKFTRVAA